MEHGAAQPSARGASPRGRCLLALAALLLSLLAVAGPAGAEASFTFQGGGWGHSVGMSQYGAYGMAREGHTWQEILTHYFTGASPAPADPALTAEPIWVGLAQEQTRISLTPVATGAGPAAAATFTIGDRSLVAAQGETVTVEILANGRCRLTGPAGTLDGPCTIDVEWDGREAEPTTALQLAGCVLPDWNAPGGTVWKPCRYARGALHIRPDNDTPTLDLALEVGIEEYLLGISESPYGWGTTGGQAALEAQAVASRSYALNRVVTRGTPESRPWCWCQIYDTTVDQFYVGWGHGTQPWLDAVAATAGQVMTHPSEVRGGRLIPILTFYASSTFGWTEDSEVGFAAYVPYLRAVDDHWSTQPDVGNPYAQWTRSFTASQLAAKLPGMATVTGAEVTRCSATGAALEITFRGQGGPRAFTTRDLRSRLDLPSIQVIEVGSPLTGRPACQGYATGTGPPGGPVTLAGISLDDDTVEDSRGNGDGRAQCGEDIEVLTSLVNDGAALRLVGATLSSDDPFVSVLWNDTSAYPDLSAGARAENISDWDLAVAADSPDGHVAHLDLRVTALNGGPWDLDLTFPIACSAGAEAGGVLASPGDLNGDGAAEVAVAYAAGGRAPLLELRDGRTGAILAQTALGRAGLRPVAAAIVPNVGGSASPEVAVLLTGPGLPGRVVVADAATGRRLKAFGLAASSQYQDIAAIAGADGPALAILTRRPNGATRALLRDPVSGARLGGIGFGRALSPMALSVIQVAGSESLAVLGDAAGSVELSLRRIGGGGARVIPLAADAAAADLATGAGPGGQPVLLALVNRSGSAPAVIVADPATGSLSSPYPVAALAQGSAIGPAPGGSWGTAAVLGSAPNGRTAVILLEAVLRQNLLTARLAVGTSADTVAMLPDGRLTLLAEDQGGTRLLILDAATGVQTASFPIL